jgi:predicted anti-sigma-YlaC factor YlaD
VHTSGAPHDGRSADEFSVIRDEVTCRQFVELVTDYFEGALEARTLNQVEEHLVMCDWCVTYVEHMQATVAALAQLSDQTPCDPPQAALGALRARRE